MKVGNRKKRGAAIIEFAVLLPLLLIIVFGIIEFGFLWLQSHYIANAAREGARIAAKLPEVDDTNGGSPPTPQVQIGVRDYLKGLYKDLTDSEIEFYHPPPASFPANPKFVVIEVDEVVLPANNPTPTQNAVRVQVTVQTHEVWKPIIWGFLAGLYPNGETITIEEISESAVFVRE